MTPGRNATIYLVLSAMGAVFITLIAWLGFSESGSTTFNDKLIVGGAFVASCLFGISLALRPGWTRRSSRARGHAHIADKRERSGRRMTGHHPDCEEFDGHVMEFMGRTVCSGCTGLALGSIVAIIFTISYIALQVDVDAWILFVLLIVGIVLVALSLADIILSLGKAGLHNRINIFLVIGFFLVVVSVHQLTGSAAFGLIAIIISFLWLDTRIQLSSKRHRDICLACDQSCKTY
ncbi:MAG: hypothetical protein KAR39_05185 [Thermoplasmata archaeon]|nr:hypothetical protein [Thermoplasmata archaeon]